MKVRISRSSAGGGVLGVGRGLVVLRWLRVVAVVLLGGGLGVGLIVVGGVDELGTVSVATDTLPAASIART